MDVEVVVASNVDVEDAAIENTKTENAVTDNVIAEDAVGEDVDVENVDADMDVEGVVIGIVDEPVEDVADGIRMLKGWMSQ